MNLLAIDYGTKRIGIATGSTQTNTAFPRAVFENNKKIKGEKSDLTPVAKQIIDFAQAEDIKTIIIGESKDFSGQENAIMPEVRELTLLLTEAGLSVLFEPEYLSSAQAEHLQVKKEMLDASAAAVILQSYFDKLKKD